jgi:integrase
MNELSTMGIKEEWLSSLLKDNTRKHHERNFNYFLEFTQSSPEQLIQLRKDEGSKRFATRVNLFHKWLMDDKGLTDNSARSSVIAVQSFFSYYDLPFKTELSVTKMKIENFTLTLEDLQKVFRLGDLQIKTLLSLMKDCPCRVNDLATKVIPKINNQKEFMIESEKENVVGKVYLSEETSELYSQLKRTGQSLPFTRMGIAKILDRASRIAEIPHINPHLLRKFFYSVGVNLNINDSVLKVLMFKAIPKSDLTYILNRNDLRDSWQKIVNSILLESKNNGKISNLQQEIDNLKKDVNFQKNIIATTLKFLFRGKMRDEDKATLKALAESFPELEEYLEDSEESNENE